jgi:thiamine biosynthesis lipoprotein
VWKQSLEVGIEPEDLILEELQPAIGWNLIQRTTQRTTHILSKPHTKMRFNFDGVAKGFCVDRLVEEINAIGYDNLYVEWGGEIRVSGQHPTGRPWRVMVTGIGGDHNPAENIEMLELNDQAIATSGDYYQQWKVTSSAAKTANNAKTANTDKTTKIYTHIVDTTTLQALEVAPNQIASATVVAPTCALADMLATTCMLFPNAKEASAWAELVQEDIPETQFWIITRNPEAL